MTWGSQQAQAFRQVLLGFKWPYPLLFGPAQSMAFCLGTLPWLVVAMGPGSDDPHAGWVGGTQLKVPESQADLQPKSSHPSNSSSLGAILVN